MVDFREYFMQKYYAADWINPARNQFLTAQPFPYIVIDNFLPEDLMNQVLDAFNSYAPSQWWQFNNKNEIKLASKDEVYLPQIIRNVLHELNSGFVLNWLQYITGVPGLVPDMHLYGGGIHKIESGGKLGIHQDFNIQQHTMMHRQLNLLLYLNKDWKEDYGGDLELWDKDKTHCVHKIAPIFNRCVLFNTATGYSWHGHPHPLTTPPEVSRKSLALYYYNVGEEAAYIASTKAKSTIF